MSENKANKTNKTQKKHKKENTKKSNVENTVTEKRKTKKRYRGKGGRMKKEDEFSIFLVNLRGFRSKKESLLQIMKKEKPNVVVMNETQLAGNMKVELETYKCWTKNRSEKGGGGIATAVCPEYQESTMGAGEGEQGDEFMVTRVDTFTPALNIIKGHALAEKADARMDFSYVPGHLGEF